MTEPELTLAIHDAIRNHAGPSVNLAVSVMNVLKSRELFIHNGEIRDIIEVDMEDSGSEYWTYKVYVEPIEEDE